MEIKIGPVWPPNSQMDNEMKNLLYPPYEVHTGDTMV